MCKFSEEQLKKMAESPSDTEETRIENSIRMIEEAIEADENLSKKTEVFIQGSYANDTNVRLNSDIDINVKYKNAFLYNLPKYMTATDFNIRENNYKFSEFKSDVEKALINKFGRNAVKRKNKCFNIKENTYRVQADVVPTFGYRKYDDKSNFVMGTAFYPDSIPKTMVRNFPKQHIENGKIKNKNTNGFLKKLVRVYKNLNNKMTDDGIKFSDNITSFLLECLVYNVSDDKINSCRNDWVYMLSESIHFIYSGFDNENGAYKNWNEVSGLLLLFGSDRKWSETDVKEYLERLWVYLEFQ